MEKKWYRVGFKWSFYKHDLVRYLNFTSTDSETAKQEAFEYLTELSELPQNRHLGNPIIVSVVRG